MSTTQVRPELWTRTPKERAVAGQDATRSKEPSAIATVACLSARQEKKGAVRAYKQKKGAVGHRYSRLPLCPCAPGWLRVRRAVTKKKRGGGVPRHRDRGLRHTEVRLCQGSIKPLLRLYQGSIKAHLVACLLYGHRYSRLPAVY